MSETEPKLEAEPVVIAEDGTKSDASEHEPILDNPQANEFSDELARQQAREIGLTEEQISALI